MSGSRAILHYTERPSRPWPSALSQCLARLPSARRGALEAAAADQQIDSLLGIALALAAARGLGWSRTAEAIEFADAGKPAWPAGPGFSVAHAAGIVACAMRCDGGAIGCDVERADAVRAGDLRLVIDDSERALLESRVLSAAALWTRKEAALKWAGLDLRHVTRPRVGVDGVVLARAQLQCVTVDLPGACVASVVADAMIEPLGIARHDPLALLGAMATMP